ncbi:redox-sensing transcriptional repressor Rex [candidate division KSB1 bacterium]|nr:redox-sensing transcriptional repressor Rex [candidate division KSB1 bacterium]RQW06703.1 MAG: redox-sensing transcriptional repressor Rex [candidate division KSB1 bacterium]
MDSQDRIRRLLNYKNLLYQLQNLGFIKVFSDNIADALGISASLVRKDFAIFNIAGSQKGGYHIPSILLKIHDILGKNEIQKIVLIGAGRLGSALLNYGQILIDEGIKIVAAFDIDPGKLDEKAAVPILSMNSLANFISENDIHFAIVTVPESSARQVMDILKAAKIQGVLNFTSLKVKSTDATIINNVNIEHELARLIYMVRQKNREPDD